MIPQINIKMTSRTIKVKQRKIPILTLGVKAIIKTKLIAIISVYNDSKDVDITQLCINLCIPKKELLLIIDRASDFVYEKSYRISENDFNILNQIWKQYNLPNYTNEKYLQDKISNINLRILKK